MTDSVTVSPIRYTVEAVTGSTVEVVDSRPTVTVDLGDDTVTVTTSTTTVEVGASQTVEVTAQNPAQSIAVTPQAGTASATQFTAPDDSLSDVQSVLVTVVGEKANITDPRFGAIGDGSTNNLAAVTAAFTAAAAVDGEVFVPPGSFRTNGTVTFPSNITLTGSGPGSLLHGITGNLFSISGILWSVRSLCLRADGGHIFNQSEAVSQGVLTEVVFVQAGPNGSIWKSAGYGYIDVSVRDCIVSMATNAAVPGWDLTGDASQAGINACQWTGGRYTSGASASAPVFKIDNPSALSFNYDLVWSDCTFEVVNGGAIWLGGCMNPTIRDARIYDTLSAGADLISVGPGSGGLQSKGGVFDHVTTRNVTKAGSYVDLKCRHSSSNTHDVRRCSGTSGGNPFVIDFASGGNSWSRGLFDSGLNTAGVTTYG